MSKLEEIDNYVYEKIKEFDVYQSLNPINAKSENEKFIELFKKGIEYNPKYEYKVEDKDCKEELIQIQRYKEELKNERDYISLKLYKTLEVLEKNLKLLDHIGESDYITKYSQDIYGCPSKELVDRAKMILKNEVVSEEHLEYDADYCRSYFEKMIKEKGFDDWEVRINEHQLAKVNVNPERKQVNVNKNARFSKNDIQRLIVHEVGTHALRSKNGGCQSYKIFSTLLENNLYVEEGLATVNEEIKNVLDKRTFRIYAGRALAVAESYNKSFYEVFCEISKYFNIEDALYIVSRAKRGIANTGDKGVFTKDYVYLHGYYEVKEFINKTNDVESLYIGAIGIDEVSECLKLIDEGKLVRPKVSIKNF